MSSSDWTDAVAKYITLCGTYKFFLETIALSVLVVIIYYSSNDTTSTLVLGEISTFAFAAYKLQPALTSIAVSMNALSYAIPYITKFEGLNHLYQNSVKNASTNCFSKNFYSDVNILTLWSEIYLQR